MIHLETEHLLIRDHVEDWRYAYDITISPQK